MSVQLLPNLRAFLVAQNVARVPGVAGPQPPLWLDPKTGVNAPGEGDNATEIGPTIVLAAFNVGGFRRGTYDQQWLRTDSVDFWIRSLKAPDAYDYFDALIPLLAPKQNWIIGALPIVESLLYRPLQRIASDGNGYTFTSQFTFERFVQ